jgi:hypothetical protein
LRSRPLDGFESHIFQLLKHLYQQMIYVIVARRRAIGKPDDTSPGDIAAAA